jgi:hypothetical protein
VSGDPDETGRSELYEKPQTGHESENQTRRQDRLQRVRMSEEESLQLRKNDLDCMKRGTTIEI